MTDYSFNFFAKQLSSPGNRSTADEVLISVNADTLDNAFIEVDRVLGTTYMWSLRLTDVVAS